MSDCLGPLLGMSPYNGLGGFGRAMAQMAPATRAQVAEQARLAANVPLDQQDWSVALNAMAFPLPEPGIHWTRTGGKSWRVEIVRQITEGQQK